MDITQTTKVITHKSELPSILTDNIYWHEWFSKTIPWLCPT